MRSNLIMRLGGLSNGLAKCHAVDTLDVLQMDALTIMVGIGGTLIGVFATHSFTHQRWLKEHKLKKLEELTIALDKHCNYYAGYLARGTDNKPATDSTTQQKEAADHAYSTLVMLVYIYFDDELAPALTRIEDVKKQASETREAYYDGDIDMGDCNAELESFVGDLKTFQNEMREKVFTVAGEVRNQGILWFWR